MGALFPFDIKNVTVIDPTKNLSGFGSIRQILYLKPNIGSLTTNLLSVGYDWAYEPPPLRWTDIYDRFLTPLNSNGTSAGPLPRSKWAGRKLTGLDIDLTALVPRTGPIAIAVNLGPPQGTGDVNISTLKFVETDTTPLAAVTGASSADVTDLSWIREDVDDQFHRGVTDGVRRTFVFVCNLGSSGKEKFIRFNLGVSLNSNSNPDWALPALFDPEIKNDG